MTDALTAKRLEINGIVQGVGFRPFIYQRTARIWESQHFRDFIKSFSRGIIYGSANYFHAQMTLD